MYQASPLIALALCPHSKLCVCVKSLQSYQILFDPMGCSLPGSSVHWILQARILGWVAISFSRRSCQPRDQIHVSFCLLNWKVGSFPLAPPEAHYILKLTLLLTRWPIPCESVIISLYVYRSSCSRTLLDFLSTEPNLVISVTINIYSLKQLCF